jgi:hypothetical protein
MAEPAALIPPRSPPARARISKGPARLRTKIGSYSRAGALSLIDGRSKEALFVRRRKAELAAHVAPGGKPSATQAVVIERCAWLSLRLAMLDCRLASGELTEHDGSAYITWSNALGRAMKLLGLKALPPPQKSFDEYVAEIVAAKREPTT